VLAFPRSTRLALVVLALCVSCGPASSHALAKSVRGGPHADRLVGGRKNDRLAGRGGDDRLLGGGGRDRLYGGAGRDRLAGGPGADVLECGPGRDRAKAKPGDVVRGSCEIVIRPETGATVPLTPPAPAPPPAPQPDPEDRTVPERAARPAASFVDSIGVNVHMNYDGSQYYGNARRLAQELGSIGIRHVRDGHQGRRADQHERLNILADAGIGITLIEDPRSDPQIPGDVPVQRCDDYDQYECYKPEDPDRWGRHSLEERVQEIADGRIRNVVALEGANEYDTTRDFGDWQWVPTVTKAQCRMQALRDTHLPHVPVYGPSQTSWQAYQAAADGGINPCVEVGAIHPYPNDNQPFSVRHWWEPHWTGSLAWHVAELVHNRVPGPGAPWAATETGYHTAVNYEGGHRPVPEGVAGVYAPKLFLEYFRQGAVRTFWYEAMDQWPNPEQDWLQDHFGLLRNDFSWKPAAASVHNLIAAVTRPGAATTGSLRYSLEGGPANLQELLLRRGDGSFALVLWQDESVWDGAARQALRHPAATLTLRLGSVADVTRQRVGAGAATAVRARSVPVEVPADDTVVVGISGR
jgi:hypothetical protein